MAPGVQASFYMPSALDGTLIHTRIGRLTALKSTISSLSPRHRLALAIALAVDFLQIVAFPLFAPGLASPVDDVLDLAAGVSLIAVMGWHWSFLPAFAVELIPGLDLVPSWTAAVLLAIRRPLAQPLQNPGRGTALPK
ncbi:MAG: hypothetical protein ABI609_06790 [Acidobacteriota bacterium]